MRRVVRETQLEPADFILPLFAVPGEGVRKPISSMPGNFQLSIDELVNLRTSHIVIIFSEFSFILALVLLWEKMLQSLVLPPL